MSGDHRRILGLRHAESKPDGPQPQLLGENGAFGIVAGHRTHARAHRSAHLDLRIAEPGHPQRLAITRVRHKNPVNHARKAAEQPRP